MMSIRVRQALVVLVAFGVPALLGSSGDLGLLLVLDREIMPGATLRSSRSRAMVVVARMKPRFRSRAGFSGGTTNAARTRVSEGARGFR